MYTTVARCMLKKSVVQLIRNYKTSNYQHEINEVVIASAVRTPIGSFQSSLATLNAPRLGAFAIEAAVKRAGIPQESINELFMGQALSAGVGQAPARQSAVYAGLPNGVCCTTVNKVCASGLKAITLGTQALQLGHADVVLSGGMESMSNVPYYMQRGAIPYGGTKFQDGIVYDALKDYSSKAALAQCAEIESRRIGICQAELNTYSNLSVKRAQTAAQDGAFLEEIAPVFVQHANRSSEAVEEDEELEFSEGPIMVGKVAISSLGDGAAALVLTTKKKAVEMGLVPLARIVGYQDVEAEPERFATASVLAVRRLLRRFDLETNNIARFEINDDVAILPIAFMKEMNISMNKINMDGGALALGHPIGMSGARLVTHLAHALREPGDLGCAAICDGDGGASAIIIEKLKNTYYSNYALPVLTLYTKTPCYLCDILVEELQLNFGGEYALEKIDITERPNERFLRLYRKDIPVVFLNGQYLCMHRLNQKLLRLKLDFLRNKRNTL